MEPTLLDCVPGSTAGELRAADRAGSARIPPPALAQSIAELRLGQAFALSATHRATIAPEQLIATERGFCRRDPDLLCLSPAERAHITGDLLARLARIEGGTRAGSPEHRGAVDVRAALHAGKLPLLSLATGFHYGPTAAVVRYRDEASGRWVLGLALARDFSAAVEDPLLLDGILVQELTHYDDLAALPAPIRCYDSNIEIRGHDAMIRFWARHRSEGRVAPRIAAALRAQLDGSRTRGAWYRYLNQIERTDFLVEDELVSLESQALPALRVGVDDDRRFLRELSRIVALALDKARDTLTHVASLGSDSINANARVMAAVSRLVPRVLENYERVRGNPRDADATARRGVTSTAVADIRRSLTVLEAFKELLVTNPDFRKKSDFVGPD